MPCCEVLAQTIWRGSMIPFLRGDANLQNWANGAGYPTGARGLRARGGLAQEPVQGSSNLSHCSVVHPTRSTARLCSPNI